MVDGADELVPSGPGRRRRLGWPGLLAVLLTILFVPQTVSLFLFGADAFDPENGALRAEVAGGLVPDFGAALLAMLAVAALGWWRRVWREPRPVRRWVVVLPASLLLVSAATIDYRNLAHVGTALAVTLIVATFFTGVSEEFMFRGLALCALRDGHRERSAALLSSLLFGATHLFNALVLGSGAIAQSILAAFLGYVLYLSRRVAGGLWLPIAVHWLFDLSLFSHTLGAGGRGELSDAAFLLFLTEIAVIAAMLIGWRRIELRAAARRG